MNSVPFLVRLIKRIKVIPYYDVPRFPIVVRGVLKWNLMKCYWCDFANFGDQITPMLLKHYGFTPLLSQPKRARLASTGSILEHLPENYSGIILGSGFILGTSKTQFPRAKVLAVRGRLTKERMGLKDRKEVKLGDPGLLASRVMRTRQSKKYELGIVPHYIDKKNPAVRKIYQAFQPHVNVIDVEQKDPMAVFQEIDKCRHILSSSLHGLIVADSLGIPNAWFYSSGLEGDRFKFDDYYSSLDVAAPERHEIKGTESLSALLSKATLKPRDSIEVAIGALDQAFLSLKKRPF